MNRCRVGVIDYGSGNIGSIVNMLKHLGHEGVVASTSKELSGFSHVILPGVGHFGRAAERLSSLGFTEALNHLYAEGKTHMLGICLGMQLMCEYSEEGNASGLGWVQGRVLRFKIGSQKVPHMGWGLAEIKRKCALTKDFSETPRFYFVHSFYVSLKHSHEEVFRTHYGLDFCSGFSQGKIHGVQFHPEKSHKYGMQLLKNFCEGDDGI